MLKITPFDFAKTKSFHTDAPGGAYPGQIENDSKVDFERTTQSNRASINAIKGCFCIREVIP